MLLLNDQTFAKNQKIYLWFVSPPAAQAFIPQFYADLWAQLDDEGNFHHGKCQEMGDEWFHPQLGVHSEGHQFAGKKKNLIDVDSGNPAMENKGLTSGEFDLVDCDTNQFFDLYCGKAPKNSFKAPTGVEVWVDTSSSLRAVDVGAGGSTCFRQMMVQNVQASCGKIDFYTFDTSKKSLGSSDASCINYGLNDADRLVEWIREFKGQHLIVITDISEFTASFVGKLEDLGVTLEGHQTNQPLYAKDLVAKTKSILALCPN